MTDRLRGMTRILKVQDQLKRMADWRLAEAERGAAEIVDAQAEIRRFMGGDTPLGSLAASAAAQSRRLAARGIAAARTVEQEAEAMRDATARQKLVAKSLEALTREEAASRERKDLERMIEGLAGRGGGGPAD